MDDLESIIHLLGFYFLGECSCQSCIFLLQMDVGVCEYVMQLITPVDDISFLYSAEIEVDHHSKIT